MKRPTRLTQPKPGWQVGRENQATDEFQYILGKCEEVEPSHGHRHGGFGCRGLGVSRPFASHNLDDESSPSKAETLLSYQ